MTLSDSEIFSDTKQRATYLRQLSFLLLLIFVYKIVAITGRCRIHITNYLYYRINYSNTVIGTLAVDGWAVTFGTARRGLGGAAARPGPSSLYQM